MSRTLASQCKLGDFITWHDPASPKRQCTYRVISLPLNGRAQVGLEHLKGGGSNGAPGEHTTSWLPLNRLDEEWTLGGPAELLEPLLDPKEFARLFKLGLILGLGELVLHA